MIRNFFCVRIIRSGRPNELFASKNYLLGLPRTLPEPQGLHGAQFTRNCWFSVVPRGASLFGSTMQRARWVDLGPSCRPQSLYSVCARLMSASSTNPLVDVASKLF